MSFNILFFDLLTAYLFELFDIFNLHAIHVLFKNIDLMLVILVAWQFWTAVSNFILLLYLLVFKPHECFHCLLAYSSLLAILFVLIFFNHLLDHFLAFLFDKVSRSGIKHLIYYGPSVSIHFAFKVEAGELEVKLVY